MTDPMTTALAGSGLSDVSRARALELLDAQRRRILEISRAVVDGEQKLQRCSTDLAWRSPSRVEFDLRVGELHDAFARSAGALRAALAECDRARGLVQASSAVERRGAGWEKDVVGYPAEARSR